MIEQEHIGIEGYTVSFWAKPIGGKPWHSATLAFEVPRWRRASLIHHEDRESIQIFRDSELMAEFRLEDGRLHLRSGGSEQSLPQKVVPFLYFAEKHNKRANEYWD